MLTFLGSGPGLGVLLISAGMLAFEISLSRTFAVQQFHHFAFVVISLAAVGLGGGGPSWGPPAAWCPVPPPPTWPGRLWAASWRWEGWRPPARRGRCCWPP